MAKAMTRVGGSSPTKAQKNVGGIGAKKEVFDVSLFCTGVYSSLISRGDCKEGEPISGNPVVAQAIDMFEANQAKASESYGNAIAALSAFNAWLDGTGWTYEEPRLFVVTGFSVSVEVPVKSGSLSVTMDIEPTEIADYKETLTQAHKLLAEAFNGAFNSGVQQLSANGKTETKTRETEQGVHCSLLRVSVFNNKNVHHVIPDQGNWVQFGIPLYKDVAKSHDIDLPDDQGEYAVDWTVTIEFKDDGKPRRVVSIAQLFDFTPFPEEGYDPSSGEYKADFDFEPIPIGEVLFSDDGKIYGKVYSFGDDDEAKRILDVLTDIKQSGQFSAGYNPDNPRDYPPVPTTFKINDKRHVRGPYVGTKLVDRFFRKSGLRKIATVYYDADIDAFWIELDTP